MVPRIRTEDGVWFIERVNTDQYSTLEFWDGYQWVAYRSAAQQFHSERDAQDALEVLGADFYWKAHASK